MSDTDVYVSPSRVPAAVALLLALIGAAGMSWSFVAGIGAALDGSGGGATPYIAVFVVNAVVVLAAVVLSIVCLVRGQARAIAGLALVVALAPLVAALILRVVNS